MRCRACGPAVQVFELDAQHRRLQFIDAKVAADERVKILRLAAVHAQHAHAFGEIGIVGRAQSGVAERAEILAREERKAADVADRSDPRAVSVLRADRLRGILDDAQIDSAARSRISGSMSADWPYRCTGMSALTRPPVARLTSRPPLGHALLVDECLHRGRRQIEVLRDRCRKIPAARPARAIVPAVAKKVNGEVMTSSPAPISSAISASSSASVPEDTPIAGRRAAILRDFRFEAAHVLAQDELLARAHALDERHDFGADLARTAP